MRKLLSLALVAGLAFPQLTNAETLAWTCDEPVGYSATTGSAVSLQHDGYIPEGEIEWGPNGFNGVHPIVIYAQGDSHMNLWWGHTRPDGMELPIEDKEFEKIPILYQGEHMIIGASSGSGPSAEIVEVYSLHLPEKMLSLFSIERLANLFSDDITAGRSVSSVFSTICTPLGPES